MFNRTFYRLFQILFGRPSGSVGYKTIPDDERQKASQLKSIWDAEVSENKNGK